MKKNAPNKNQPNKKVVIKGRQLTVARGLSHHSSDYNNIMEAGVPTRVPNITPLDSEAHVGVNFLK